MKGFGPLCVLVLLGLIILLGGLSLEAVGQKRSTRGTDDNTQPPTSNTLSGPKRSNRIPRGAEQVKVITKPEFIKVIVKPNKGYLSVVAVTSAAIKLTPLTSNRKNASVIKEIIKEEDGSLNIINLRPGRYKIVVEHEDYHPYTDTIQVDPARPDTFVATNKMVSKYGAIRIGGDALDAKLFLNEKVINSSSLTVDNQGITIPKVPVGKYRLKVSKEGYVEFNKEIEVPPGEQAFVSVQLEMATITLSLRSLPGSRVYVGSEEKAVIPPDGKVNLSLTPGTHTVRLLKDGYQEWKKELALSLANSHVAEIANLVPVPNSAEGDWQPSIGARKWNAQSTDWKFDSKGALIRGEKAVLFDTEPDRDFNIYQNFKFEFDVVFKDGKGVAWIVRAKDPNNYYLFEINGPQGSSPNTFHFYLCQDGKLQWKDSRMIVDKLDKKGESFHIIFEARGNQFDTRMTIASAPSAQPRPIGIFEDNTFSYGGIGFRSKDQSEALLQTLFIIPLR
jgi:PEGA domain